MLQNREGQRHDRRSVQEQDGCRLLASRRFHADLLVDPPAALQRTGPRVLQRRRGQHRLRVGQRHLRHERMGQGPGIGQYHAAARRQRRLHRRHGHAGRQERPGLRQAQLALFDAGEGRRRPEDVHRTRKGRRPV
ncbi:hypothetical protein G6F68_018605 [Rhizopus microsporus]|nr:hypothetical protein G6F68_018605 [Rhizopus microsporus]